MSYDKRVILKLWLCTSFDWTSSCSSSFNWVSSLDFWKKRIWILLTPCPKVIFPVFLSSADFFSKSTFSKNSFRNAFGVSNTLDPDQALLQKITYALEICGEHDEFQIEKYLHFPEIECSRPLIAQDKLFYRQKRRAEFSYPIHVTCLSHPHDLLIPSMWLQIKTI